ncbi:hypothetical protein [Streptomyces melanogenes]|uniref:hypothetical protein n=1 Tax=Streptomyces melanogenes TaxID=67326 RepID=UPI0037BD10DE
MVDGIDIRADLQEGKGGDGGQSQARDCTGGQAEAASCLSDILTANDFVPLAEASPKVALMNFRTL